MRMSILNMNLLSNKGLVLQQELRQNLWFNFWDLNVSFWCSFNCRKKCQERENVWTGEGWTIFGSWGEGRDNLPGTTRSTKAKRYLLNLLRQSFWSYWSLNLKIQQALGKRVLKLYICLEVWKVYSKPFQNKMFIEIDRPLGPEPRVTIQMPKPEPRGEEFFEDYTSPLDGPSRLDKYYKDKNFGFYGKGFRSTHAQSLNFFNYRKANTIGHPNARFEIDENDFIEVYCDLYFHKPTPEDFSTRRPLPMAVMIIGWKRQVTRKIFNGLQRQKQLFEKRKECLKDEIARAERLEYAYDDLVSDITELFSSGEKIQMKNLWVAVRSPWQHCFGILEIGMVVRIGWSHPLLISNSSTTMNNIQIRILLVTVVC